MIHVLQLCLVLLFFWVGHREAENFEYAKGVTPWGLSPWVWGVIAGFSLVLGAILITIAKRTTKIPAPAAVEQRSISGPDPWSAPVHQPAGPGTGPGPWSAPASQPAPDNGATFTPSSTILPPR